MWYTQSQTGPENNHWNSRHWNTFKTVGKRLLNILSQSTENIKILPTGNNESKL